MRHPLRLLFVLALALCAASCAGSDPVAAGDDGGTSTDPDKAILLEIMEAQLVDDTTLQLAIAACGSGARSSSQQSDDLVEITVFATQDFNEGEECADLIEVELEHASSISTVRDASNGREFPVTRQEPAEEQGVEETVPPLPSTTEPPPGVVAEVRCNDNNECAEAFILNGRTYSTSCTGIADEDAILLDEQLGSGTAFSQEVVVYALKGHADQGVVAVSIESGCTGEPTEEISEWTFAWVEGADPLPAICDFGLLTAELRQVNGCDRFDESAASGDEVEILTADENPDFEMNALGGFTLLYDADQNCLYHDEADNNGEPGTGGRVTVMWPFGFTATVEYGEVTIFDTAGSPVARTGEAFQIAGGGVQLDTDYCDVIGVWIAAPSSIEPLEDADD